MRTANKRGSCQDRPMAETVSDTDPEPQESQLDDAVFEAPRVCLRCDWIGETDGETCPKCEAALYRLPESTKLRGVTPIPRPQPQSAGDPIPSSPVEVPQQHENDPQAVPVAARRWRVIVGAFTVAALWILATDGLFERFQAPTAHAPSLAVATTRVNESPTANPADDAMPTDGVLRRGNEVVEPEGPNLVAVDPDTGASRILLDRAVGTDPLPIAVGGEVIREEITNVAWSPDGRWVAFDGPGAALWVMNSEIGLP